MAEQAARQKAHLRSEISERSEIIAVIAWRFRCFEQVEQEHQAVLQDMERVRAKLNPVHLKI